jgi:cyclic-di-GMP phosphodiesterase TipF (flagellum assembly factor)
MLRIAAIFVAVCIVLIAASLGAVAYLFFGLTGAESSILSLAVLLSLTLYNMISSRVRDRTDVGDQIADLSRGSADLARQVAELSRRVATVENDARSVAGRAKAATDPLASEIGELGGLIKQLAETVAAHEAVLSSGAKTGELRVPAANAAQHSTSEARGQDSSTPFKGRGRDAIVAMIRAAVDANRVDLYLQPILTLPQRKVRYYEGMTRLRNEQGELMLPADFLHLAEAEGLMPKIDNLLLFRCVQVLRRLLAKNRDIGLFCNISTTTLHDPDFFPQFSQFIEANRALAPSLMLEFTQNAISTLGPIEQENLAALAEMGFRFSMDQVTDLRMEPRNLAERGIRFVKVPAALLLNRAAAPADIAASDLSDLFGRHGISLIAERIETEAVVVDLLDYDVRFGQGFLFSPPRPVRAEALQGIAERNDVVVRDTAAPAPESAPRRTEGNGAIVRHAI